MSLKVFTSQEIQKIREQILIENITIPKSCPQHRLLRKNYETGFC